LQDSVNSVDQVVSDSRRCMAEKNMSRGSKKEIQLVRNWLTHEDPISIATHMQVDADAAFSTALLHVLRPHARVKFVRADSCIKAENCIAVDLSKGPRAVKGLHPGSAFGLVVNVMRDIDRPVHDALRDWAAQLNLTDSGKYCRDKVSLAELTSCWKAIGLRDKGIVEKAEELIRGKIASHRKHLEHKAVAEKVPIVKGVAVVKANVRVKAADLFRRGAIAVVRESEIGMGVNLSKQAQNKGIRLTQCKKLLPKSWFIHPAGFLACYGSVKAPKNPADSGLKLAELVKIIQKWLAAHEKIGELKVK
jgi:hypothetical protein